MKNKEPETHTLKCWSEYFIEIFEGRKTFELRKDDRNYKVGDTLILEEGDIQHDDFVRTGRTVKATITYIIKDAVVFGLQKGYCILSLSTPSLNMLLPVGEIAFPSEVDIRYWADSQERCCFEEDRQWLYAGLNWAISKIKRLNPPVSTTSTSKDE
jgi:hypothetical protein